MLTATMVRLCKNTFALCVVQLIILGITCKIAAFIPNNGCGRTYYTRSETFSSPSFYYPKKSVKVETCTWRISARSDERIILNITDIDIKKSPDCVLGYVEVRDGLWPSSPILGRYCGTGRLDPIISSENAMLVSYVYKNPSGYRGFFANYEAICGSDLYVDKEYLLENHKSNKNYELNRKCIWNIIVPGGQQVVLKFQEFELEEQEGCLYDYVEIIDGPSADTNNASLGTFCGNKTPPVVISTSNHLIIKFVSDASVEKMGFSVKVLTEYDECVTRNHGCAHQCINTIGGYRCSCKIGYELQSNGKNCEKACGGTLYGGSGTINSPSFPEFYPPNKTCIWEIVTSPENVISLTFTHFDMEGKNITNNKKHRCEQDALEVFSKFNENRTRRHGVYCGNTLPDSIVSESNVMRIMFTSDIDVQETGFVLEYFTFMDNCKILNGNCYNECVNTASGLRKCSCSEDYVLQENGFDCKKDECQYEIASTFGYVNSLNYPADYPNNKLCSWRFRTVAGHRVRISFLDFRTENNDQVALYDGLFTNSTLLGIFKGNTLPSTKVSTDHVFYMVFKTNDYYVEKGFNAKFDSICGGIFQANTEEKYIFSHANYASPNYENNANCDWIIKPISGYNTSLTIVTFQLEDTVDCEYDFVEIFEGENWLGKFCGYNKPAEIFESNANFSIRFRSDDSITDKGFIMMYKAVENIFEPEFQTL